MIEKIKLFYHKLFDPMKLDNNFGNYDEYWRARGFHEPSLKRAGIISCDIKAGGRILDIGCGDGTMIDFLSKNNKPKEIIGLDISSRAVAYIKSRKYEAYEMDILSDRFAEFMKGRSFDYIILSEVLEHLSDPEKVITAIRENFSKSIFISVPNAGFFAHRLRLLFGRFPQVLIQQHTKEHLRFWTVKDFIYWSNFLGFKVDRVTVSVGLGIKPLAFLEKMLPGLFGCQLIYQLSRVNVKS